MFAVRPSFAQAVKVLGQSLTDSPAVPATVPETVKKSDSFELDISAQSLAAALDRYAVITGNPVVFPSKLVVGRNSSAVNGRYQAGTALEMLLQGTGLGAEHLHEGGLDTFVLKLLPVQDVTNVVTTTASRENPVKSASDIYDAVVQARVWETFCSDTRTAPGNYRALLRFRIDEEGHVHQPRLLSSTGDQRRDAMLTDALGKVNVGQPPPAGMVQPLTMLMLPRGQIAGRSCRAEVR